MSNKTVEILAALDDEISLELFFNNALKSTIDPDRGKKLSKKQYYTRLRKLVETGLLKRAGSKYHHTARGEVMIKTLDLIQKALDNKFMLDAYDAMKKQNVGIDLASKLLQDQELIDILDKKRVNVGVES